MSPMSSEVSGGSGDGSASGENGIMLFGVRVTENPFRKSVSMNNLSQYEQTQESNVDVAAGDGYESDDVVHASARSRERKRGVPWTEDEHRLFLLGLQKVGKGDWRGISRNFVKTRTPTQVASHAQKFFLRRNNQNRRRRRSSLFDITTAGSFTGSSMEENHLGGFPGSNFPATPPLSRENSMENLTLGTSNQAKSSTKLIRPIPILPVPPSSKMAKLNLNQASPMDPLPLSLKLSTPSSAEPPPSQSTTHSSAFQAMSGKFSSSTGDSFITVA